MACNWLQQQLWAVATRLLTRSCLGTIWAHERTSSYHVAVPQATATLGVWKGGGTCSGWAVRTCRICREMSSALALHLHISFMAANQSVQSGNLLVESQLLLGAWAPLPCPHALGVRNGGRRRSWEPLNTLCKCSPSCARPASSHLGGAGSFSGGAQLVLRFGGRSTWETHVDELIQQWNICDAPRCELMLLS